tara:strand:- start:29182 stop:29700 length:519 start_codon:yes stop_codon:yes gene_type:complete
MLASLEAFGSSPWCEPIPEQYSSTWASDAFDTSDVIVLGYVHSVEYASPVTDDDEKADRKASSMKELLEMIEQEQSLEQTKFDHIIKLRVERAWKGAANAKFITARVFLGKRVRMNPIRLGETYLIVGRDTDSFGVWIRNRCNDAVKEEWATNLVLMLDDILIARQAAGQNP